MKLFSFARHLLIAALLFVMGVSAYSVPREKMIRKGDAQLAMKHGVQQSITVQDYFLRVHNPKETPGGLKLESAALHPQTTEVVVGGRPKGKLKIENKVSSSTWEGAQPELEYAYH